MRTWLSLLLVGFCVLTGASAAVHAEETDLDYTFGVVKEVTPQAVVVTEYNYADGSEIDVTYEMGQGLELEGFDSVDAIKAGDDIELDYYEQDGKRTAMFIGRDVAFQEETDAV